MGGKRNRGKKNEREGKRVRESEGERGRKRERILYAFMVLLFFRE